MRDYFNVKYLRTTYRTEILAGFSMFFSVVYILLVNPQILSQCGMDYYSVFMATTIISSLATLAMAIYAKMPIVLAPGLSINYMFVWVTQNVMDGDYRLALLATYLSGILFILLMMTGMFRKIDKRIPKCVKYGILTGVGLSLIRTGLNSIQFFNHPIQLETLLVMMGIALMLFLQHKKVQGAIFYGMLLTAIIGYLIYVALDGNGFAGEWEYLVEGQEKFVWNNEGFLKNCFNVPSVAVFLESPRLFVRVLLAAVSFMFFHFADAVGTTSSLFEFMKESGTLLPEEYKRKSMYVNGAAEMASGLLGSSAATSYAETVVGVAEGAKTGVAGLTVSVLFLAAGFIIPRTGNIASFVTAPAVIVAGAMSCKIIKRIRNWNRGDQIVTIVLGIYIGLTFQVALGLVLGMALHGISNLVRKYK